MQTREIRAGGSSKGTRRWPRILLAVVCGIALTGAIIFAVPRMRTGLLRAAGHALVAEDPLITASGAKRHADVIVVSKDADGMGILEAADLVHDGIADRVAVFADPPDAVDREFLRRGIPYFNAAAVSIQQLGELGIHGVDEIPWPVEGTHDEVNVLPAWCRRKGFRTVVFVSTSDHSRRTRRLLDRTMPAAGLRVLVRYSRYSEFDPDAWWRTRDGMRTEIVESEKLLLDVLRHPFAPARPQR